MIVACRIAAGGDKRFRQSRLGADDSFRQDDDSLEDKDDFAKFDEPTRIEGEGGDVDPDPGDRESVSAQHAMPPSTWQKECMHQQAQICSNHAQSCAALICRSCTPQHA